MFKYLVTFAQLLTSGKDQIKDALLNFTKTNITITSNDGDTVLVSGLFETPGFQTREDWESKRQKSKAFVRFYPLVTQGIKSSSSECLITKRA